MDKTYSGMKTGRRKQEATRNKLLWPILPWEKLQKLHYFALMDTKWWCSSAKFLCHFVRNGNMRTPVRIETRNVAGNRNTIEFQLQLHKLKSQNSCHTF